MIARSHRYYQVAPEKQRGFSGLYYDRHRATLTIGQAPYGINEKPVRSRPLLQILRRGMRSSQVLPVIFERFFGITIANRSFEIIPVIRSVSANNSFARALGGSPRLQIRNDGLQFGRWAGLCNLPTIRDREMRRIVMRKLSWIADLACKLFVLAILAASATVTCTRSAFSAGSVPVTLRLDIFFYGAHVPLIAGIVDGTYAKHGLQVTALTGRGSATTIQTVGNGSDDFGFADAGTLVKLSAQGLKAKMIVGMLQKSPMVIITKASSGLKTLKDLNGKTGGFTAGSAPEEMLPALASKGGLDLNTIKRVVVDIPTRDNIFLSDQTDFSFGFTVAQVPILLERCGCKLNLIHYSDYGISALSNGIITNDAMLSQKPDVVREFAAATIESINKAIRDPGTAIEEFFKYAQGKTQLSRNVVSEQWAQTIKLLKTSNTQNKGYGWMSAKDWNDTIKLLERYGSVPSGTVTSTMVYTDEFLPK